MINITINKEIMYKILIFFIKIAIKNKKFNIKNNKSFNKLFKKMKISFKMKYFNQIMKI